MHKPFSLAEYCFRDAELLDIPYIFELVVRSSLADGSFSETFLTPIGYLKLLTFLLCGLKSFRRFNRGGTARRELVVVEHLESPVGFLLCTHGESDKGYTYTYLDQCVVAESERGRGHGRHIVEWLVRRQSERAPLIIAHCNRYARAMQHIFKKRHFARRSVGKGLELYLLNLTGKEIVIGNGCMHADLRTDAAPDIEYAGLALHAQGDVGWQRHPAA